MRIIESSAIAIAIVIFMFMSTGIAFAEGDIELTAIAQQEVASVDEDGKESTKLVEAAKVVPGDVVIYTITAKNISDKPVERVVINDPIPVHMTYVLGSAEGEGTDITLSADGGKAFAQEKALKVVDEDGSTRVAEAKDVTHIRWAFGENIPPSESRSVRFRARLN